MANWDLSVFWMRGANSHDFVSHYLFFKSVCWGNTMTKQIGDLAKDLLDIKEKIELGKTYLSELQQRYDSMGIELMNQLEVLNLDSFKAYDYTFYPQEKESVRIPKDEESKEKFYSWLKEQGLFDSMISVNSQTLNSLYKAKAEEALKDGILDFKIAGIDEATTYKQLRIRKL